jgi:S-adenosyl-L-methionine hydrolase (adenosine-forming)
MLVQMTSNQILTLTSDFGFSDVYVGVMKGAIAQVNPHLTVIDLTHDIPPQNIAAARFCLLNAYRYFPDGTVHVAVVDPGVGSNRRAIAIEFSNGFLIGPDNGIFSGVLSQSPAIAAVELTHDRYWRTSQPSNTFHGRDIFAPVGAHLARGVPLVELGRTVDLATLVQLGLPQLTYTLTGILGCIQYIDRFGNLVTNIPGSDVENKTWTVRLAAKIIPGCHTYSDVPPGEAIALVGSHGWVEVAINCGNAQTKLQQHWGDKVEVVISH